MSTETTSSTTTTARTTRVAVTSSPFTGQKGPRFNPSQATVPQQGHPNQGPAHRRLSQASQPRNHLTLSAPSATPPPGRSSAPSAPAHPPAPMHLHTPPPIQIRLSHPHPRHPNPIDPPPRKRRPNLTLQPRTPRP